MLGIRRSTAYLVPALFLCHPVSIRLHLYLQNHSTMHCEINVCIWRHVVFFFFSKLCKYVACSSKLNCLIGILNEFDSTIGLFLSLNITSSMFTLLAKFIKLSGWKGEAYIRLIIGCTTYSCTMSKILKVYGLCNLHFLHCSLQCSFPGIWYSTMYSYHFTS